MFWQHPFFLDWETTELRIWARETLAALTELKHGSIASLGLLIQESTTINRPRLTLDRCKDALFVNLSRQSRLSKDLILQFYFETCRHPWPNKTIPKKKPILSVSRFDVLAEVTDSRPTQEVVNVCTFIEIKHFRVNTPVTCPVAKLFRYMEMRLICKTTKLRTTKKRSFPYEALCTQICFETEVLNNNSEKAYLS